MYIVWEYNRLVEPNRSDNRLSRKSAWLLKCFLVLGINMLMLSHLWEVFLHTRPSISCLTRIAHMWAFVAMKLLTYILKNQQNVKTKTPNLNLDNLRNKEELDNTSYLEIYVQMKARKAVELTNMSVSRRNSRQVQKVGQTRAARAAASMGAVYGSLMLSDSPDSLHMYSQRTYMCTWYSNVHDVWCNVNRMGNAMSPMQKLKLSLS